MSFQDIDGHARTPRAMTARLTTNNEREAVITRWFDATLHSDKKDSVAEQLFIEPMLFAADVWRRKKHDVGDTHPPLPPLLYMSDTDLKTGIVLTRNLAHPTQPCRLTPAQIFVGNFFSDRRSNGTATGTRVPVVLKFIHIDAESSFYIHKCVQQTRAALEHSVWSELYHLHVCRRLALAKATPCLLRLYGHAIVFSDTFAQLITEPIDGKTECDLVGAANAATIGSPITLDSVSNDLPELADVRSSVRLAMCTEFLSNVTLLYWINTHFMDAHLLPQKLITQAAKQTYLRIQLSSVLMHICAALYALRANGREIKHNDLHTHNIMLVHSRDAVSHYMYAIGDRVYSIANDIGGCLQQLPVICDFGHASTGLSTASGRVEQNVDYQHHYHTSQQCYFHRNYSANNTDRCRFDEFCDVQRLFRDICMSMEQHVLSCRQNSYHTAMAMHAAQPFFEIARIFDSCSHDCRKLPWVSLANFIDETFGRLFGHSSSLPAVVPANAVLYTCDAALSVQSDTAV